MRYTHYIALSVYIESEMNADTFFVLVKTRSKQMQINNTDNCSIVDFSCISRQDLIKRKDAALNCNGRENCNESLKSRSNL